MPRDPDRALWNAVRHAGRRGFIWRIAVRNTLLPFLVLTGIIQQLRNPSGDVRADLIRFWAVFLGTALIMVPVIYWWANRFWTRCERKFGERR